MRLSIAAFLLAYSPLAVVALPPNGEPLPDGAIAQLGSPAFRHDSTIRALALAPDGNTLACGGNGTIGMIDVRDGRLLDAFSAHGGNVVALAFAPLGGQLASVGADGTACLWDVDAAGDGPRWTYRWREGPVSRRTRLARVRVTPDGRFVVLTDGIRQFWTLATADGRIVQQAREPRGQHASLSADGGLFLVARSGNRIGVRETVTGKRRPDVTLTVPGVRFSAADGRGLMLECFEAVGNAQRVLLGTERTLASVDLDSGKIVATVARRLSAVAPEPSLCTAFSPDAAQIAVVWSTLEGTTLEVHAWPDGKECFRSVLGNRPVDAVAFSPDGRCLAVADGSRVRVWDVASGDERPGAPGHDDTVVSVIFSADGSLAATLGLDQTARLWQTTDGRQQHVLPAQVSWQSQHAAVLSPDGRLLAVDQGDAVALVACDDGRTIHRLALPTTVNEPKADDARIVAFSPDGSECVTWSFADAVLRRWDVASGSPSAKHAIDVADRKVEPIGAAFLGLPSGGVFSPKLDLLAAIRFVGEDVVAWQTETGQRSFHLKAPSPLTSIAFSPDGRLLAVGRTSGLVQLWDPREDRLRHSLEGPTCGSFPRAFLDDGRTLATEHPDNTSRFWDVATGREVGRVEGHRLRAFSSDGRRAASIAPRHVVLIWDMARIR